MTSPASCRRPFVGEVRAGSSCPSRIRSLEHRAEDPHQRAAAMKPEAMSVPRSRGRCQRSSLPRLFCTKCATSAPGRGSAC